MSEDGSWRDAQAAFDAGQPAELIRAPQVIRVIFTRSGGGWTATSPDVTGFTAGPAADQAECQREAVGLLGGWAGDHVTLELIAPAAGDPEGTSGQPA